MEWDIGRPDIDTSRQLGRTTTVPFFSCEAPTCCTGQAPCGETIKRRSSTRTFDKSLSVSAARGLFNSSIEETLDRLNISSSKSREIVVPMSCSTNPRFSRWKKRIFYCLYLRSELVYTRQRVSLVISNVAHNVNVSDESWCRADSIFS